MEKYRANHNCDSCGGKRLKPESLAVKVDAHDISDIARLSIGEARDWFAALSEKLQGQESEIAARILKNQRTARISGQCWAELFVDVAQFRDIVWW